MEKVDLDYEKTLKTKLGMIADYKHMVLSTCFENKVTSRTITSECHEESVYFLTWGHHTKCDQIRKNPNVALCFKKYQIEGVAEIKGNYLLESNQKNLENYKAILPKLYNSYTENDEMVLVKVDIKEIHSWEDWENEYDGYLVDIVDIPNKKAFKINAKASKS